MKNVTTNQILETYGLDFQIEKLPSFVVNAKGERVETPYFGLLNTKTNEVINSVKKSYCVSQNSEIVDMVLQGIRPFSDELEITKAGSLNGGRKVFIQMEINGLGKVNDEIIKRYVTILDSNDGSTSLSCGVGSLTMSCQNQFRRFYKDSQSKLRHTDAISYRIAEIPSLLKNALGSSLREIELFNKMSDIKVSTEQIDTMVKEMLGYNDLSKDLSTKSLNHMNLLYSHIDKEMNQKGDSLYGLFNGATSFTTHELSVKNLEKRENSDIESLLVGNAYKISNKAFDTALMMM